MNRPERRGLHYLTGTFGALCGAVVGALPFALALTMGLAIPPLGLFIGVFADLGYRIFQGTKSPAKLLSIVPCALLAMLALAALADVFTVWRALGEGWILGVGTEQLTAVFARVLLHSDAYVFRSAYLLSLTALFTLLGTLTALIGGTKSVKKGLTSGENGL